jgi:hypothetical protein
MLPGAHGTQGLSIELKFQIAAVGDRQKRVRDPSMDGCPRLSLSINRTWPCFLPFTYGTAVTVDPYLFTTPQYFATGPATDSTPYTSTVDFFDTASLNSAIVYAGTPQSLGLENFSAVISSASGLSYGPNGITAVPLPAALWLMLSGFGGLGLLARKRIPARELS